MNGSTTPGVGTRKQIETYTSAALNHACALPLSCPGYHNTKENAEYLVFYVLYYIRYFTGAVLSPRAPGGRAHLETANKTHMENSAVCDRSHRRDAGATPVAGRSRYDSLTPLTLSLCKTIQLYRYRHRYLTCDWSGMTGGLKFGTRGACIWPGGLACAN